MLNKAVVDLRLLRKNAWAIKSKLNKGTKFNAVVKADAYGHGAPRIANELYSLVDSFSVATVNEGVGLRLSGIDKQILVLVPVLEQDIPCAVFYNLTLTVDSVETVFMLKQECARQNRKLCVQLKFNSGMNRFGVNDLKQLREISECVKNTKYLFLDGMFSHFACPQNKKERINAQNKFLLANNLIKGYNNKATCHISASGGFLEGVQTDMVRIGLLLYGYKPFESNYLTVKPIMKVYAPVIKNRYLKEGESALYGLIKSPKAQPISIVRYGYADGLLRKQIGGQFNNRCMDVSAVLGEHQHWVAVMDNAHELAKKYGTISYEVLTKCAFKSQKIYLT